MQISRRVPVVNRVIPGKDERRGESANISQAKNNRIHGGRESDIVSQGAIRKHREEYNVSTESAT